MCQKVCEYEKVLTHFSRKLKAGSTNWLISIISSKPWLANILSRKINSSDQYPLKARSPTRFCKNTLEPSVITDEISGYYSYIFTCISSLLSVFVWYILHKFWRHFMLNTNLDYFRKVGSNERVDESHKRLILKPNDDNCSLNAFHAVNLLYYTNLSVVTSLYLISGYGSISSM